MTTSPLAPIGRDRELSALRAALAAALAGRGSLVLVGGEAGIGKTTLAETICDEATAQGMLVLVGHSYDLSETPPYGPWHEALAATPANEYLPDSATLLRGGAGIASQGDLFATVRDHLAAAARQCPLVILLDDLHWADPASLDLLRFLARQLAALPLLVLATYRADELTRRHSLYQLLPSLVREARAIRIDLRPLDQAALLTLVRTRYALPTADEARLVAHLHARAEGNPFFTGELLRALEEGAALRQTDAAWTLGDLAAIAMPPLLRQVIDARLDRLGEAARGLLAVAAVIGQDVPLALWADVADARDHDLLGLIERAAEVRVLEPTADGARFAHALIREALYEGTLPLRRRVVHRRVAEALLNAAVPDPDAVAYHLQQASDSRAAEWLLAAGERARRAYAWVSSADRYETALLLLPEHANDLRGWLLLRLAVLRRYTEPRRAIAYLDEAERLATATTDPALAALAAYLRGHLRCLVGEIERGVVELAAGIDARESLPLHARARLDSLTEAAGLAPGGERGLLANWLGVLGRLEEARAAGERVLAAPPPPAMPGHMLWPYGDAFLGLSLAYSLLGDPAAAQHTYERGRGYFQAVGHHHNRGQLAADNLKFSLRYRADDLPWRRGLRDELVDAFGRASGAIAFSAHAPALPLLLLEGHWDEAEALGHAVNAQQVPWMLYASTIAPVLGQLARARGAPDAAWRVIQIALPDGNRTFLVGSALNCLAAALAADVGDLPTARTWLEADDRWLAWSGAVLGLAEAQLGWATYYRAAGDLDLAYQRAERALTHATEPRQPLALLAAHRLLGELDTEAGHHADAATHLDAALALADACAAPYERALTLLALAELRAAENQVAGAQPLLAEARVTFAALGAQPALARAETLAARLAGPVAPPPPPFGLSPREAEVLRLVAQGLSNADVGQRLFLSPRTVEQHLRSIFNKLGVENRAAATRLAVDHGLT